jgi:hypothetical protein
MPVIWRHGHAVYMLEPLAWLAGLDVVYCGAVGTHGWVILNLCRSKIGFWP